MSAADYIDSHYARTLAEPGRRAALEEVIEVETCVIGGGLAGIATALELAERGRSVVLLEAHRIGWGASGRNGGFVSPGFPGGLPALVEKVGLADARTLYGLSRGAQLLLRERIDRYGIDCGRIVDGALRCAMAESRESLQRTCDDMAEKFGMEYEYWPRERVRQTLATTQYGDAFFNPYTYSLHPLNLARGLATAVERLGGRIFEHSAVLSMDVSGHRKTVRTARGTVHAEQVVLACGGYLAGLPVQGAPRALSLATIPIATFVMVTEPLGDRLKQAIGVDYAISDIKFATNYYRPLADGRLLWGGRVLAWEPAAARLAQMLKRDMATFYPDLRDARVEIAWGGLMSYLRHKLPVVGQLGAGVWFATGFGGLGMGLTTLAGQLIGAGIAEQDDRWRLLSRFGLPFAGGRWGRVPAQLVYWRHQAEARLAKIGR